MPLNSQKSRSHIKPVPTLYHGNDVKNTLTELCRRRSSSLVDVIFMGETEKVRFWSPQLHACVNNEVGSVGRRRGDSSSYAYNVMAMFRVLLVISHDSGGATEVYHWPESPDSGLSQAFKRMESCRVFEL